MGWAESLMEVTGKQSEHQGLAGLDSCLALFALLSAGQNSSKKEKTWQLNGREQAVRQTSAAEAPSLPWLVVIVGRNSLWLIETEGTLDGTCPKEQDDRHQQVVSNPWERKVYNATLTLPELPSGD